MDKDIDVIFVENHPESLRVIKPLTTPLAIEVLLSSFYPELIENEKGLRKISQLLDEERK